MNAELQESTALREQNAEPPTEQATNLTCESSISLTLSLSTIITGTVCKFKGKIIMQRTSPIPRRASRPADVTEEYDDKLPGAIPRSQLRYRPMNPTQAGQDVTHTPHTTTQEEREPYQFSRLWLFLLPLVIATLIAITAPGLSNQWHSGDYGTHTWTINSDKFTTWTDNGQVNILVYPHNDATHAQLLPSRLLSNGKHIESVTVELMRQDNKVLVFFNGTQVGELVPNGKGGYRWT